MAKPNRRRNQTNSSTLKDDTLTKLDSLASKTKEAKKLENPSFKKNYTSYYKVLFLGIVIIGSLGVYSLFNGSNGGILDIGGSGNPSAVYINCITSEDVHYHFHLNIYIDNNIQNIPNNMGIRGNCVSAVHTHSEEVNYIHVEMQSSITTRPSLIDVFAVYRAVTDSKATLFATELMSVSGNVTATLNGANLSNFLQYVPVESDTINLYV
jgi:hypothetical protein